MYWLKSDVLVCCCSQNQYIFLYETIMEGIIHDYDEFPVTNLKQRLAQLEDVDKDGLSGAEKEFKVSLSVLHSRLCGEGCVYEGLLVRSDLRRRGRPHDGGMGNGYFNSNTYLHLCAVTCMWWFSHGQEQSSCEVIPALLVVMLLLQRLVIAVLSSTTVMSPSVPSSTVPCQYCMSSSTVRTVTLHVILFHRTLSAQPRWTHASSVTPMLTPTNTRTDS